MLYDAVAELFGVENDHNLQTAVDRSGVSVLDFILQGQTFTDDDRRKLTQALNEQTDAMIRAELASGANRMTLEEMLFQLSQVPNVRVTGLSNRKTRRANKKKA